MAKKKPVKNLEDKLIYKLVITAYKLLQVNLLVVLLIGLLAYLPLLYRGNNLVQLALISFGELLIAQLTVFLSVATIDKTFNSRNDNVFTNFKLTWRQIRWQQLSRYVGLAALLLIMCADLYFMQNVLQMHFFLPIAVVLLIMALALVLNNILLDVYAEGHAPQRQSIKWLLHTTLKFIPLHIYSLVLILVGVVIFEQNILFAVCFMPGLVAYLINKFHTAEQSYLQGDLEGQHEA
ncbi:MAG: hypothetical protein LBT80_09405 [Lactobacillaceae bacterium]|jgi:hypothetical protein|nr:hypothetical protein [Lactobacillaceae bacterium]